MLGVPARHGRAERGEAVGDGGGGLGGGGRVGALGPGPAFMKFMAFAGFVLAAVIGLYMVWKIIRTPGEL